MTFTAIIGALLFSISATFIVAVLRSNKKDFSGRPEETENKTEDKV